MTQATLHPQQDSFREGYIRLPLPPHELFTKCGYVVVKLLQVVLTQVCAPDDVSRSHTPSHTPQGGLSGHLERPSPPSLSPPKNVRFSDQER